MQGMRCRIKIKVILRAPRSEVVGWEGDHLLVRLAAIPEKGEANRLLLALLVKRLDIDSSRVQLISGATTRFKWVEVEGMDRKKVQERLP
jgi:uncharacterized protein YggU (UPF0235/DUF167 family)